jgi:hypothetical protein
LESLQVKCVTVPSNWSRLFPPTYFRINRKFNH